MSNLPFCVCAGTTGPSWPCRTHWREGRERRVGRPGCGRSCGRTRKTGTARPTRTTRRAWRGRSQGRQGTPWSARAAGASWTCRESAPVTRSPVKAETSLNTPQYGVPPYLAATGGGRYLFPPPPTKISATILGSEKRKVAFESPSLSHQTRYTLCLSQLTFEVTRGQSMNEIKLNRLIGHMQVFILDPNHIEIREKFL